MASGRRNIDLPKTNWTDAVDKSGQSRTVLALKRSRGDVSDIIQRPRAIVINIYADLGRCNFLHWRRTI